MPSDLLRVLQVRIHAGMVFGLVLLMAATLCAGSGAIAAQPSSAKAEWNLGASKVSKAKAPAKSKMSAPAKPKPSAALAQPAAARAKKDEPKAANARPVTPVVASRPAPPVAAPARAVAATSEVNSSQVARVQESSVSSAPPQASPSMGASTSEDGTLPDYTLSSNDKLKITVFGEEDLSGQFVVDASGNISMPLIGEVRAAGTSLRVLQRNIEAKLRAGYLVDPRVSAEMLNFRPFYVLGEVTRPGEYPYAAGLTLLNAIAQAGGFTPLANTSELGIRRDKAADEDRIVVRAGQPILPGDTIRVDKAVVYILGEVDKPGEYPIPPGLNVVTAVAQAGGYTALADINTIKLKQAGLNEEITVPTSSAQLVRAGDTLRVEKSSFFILGEVSKPGEYPLLQALTVNNAAALAGGFTFRADVRRVLIRRAGEADERSYKLDSNLRVQKGDTIRVPERFF